MFYKYFTFSLSTDKKSLCTQNCNLFDKLDLLRNKRLYIFVIFRDRMKKDL